MTDENVCYFSDSNRHMKPSIKALTLRYQERLICLPIVFVYRNFCQRKHLRFRRSIEGSLFKCIHLTNTSYIDNRNAY